MDSEAWQIIGALGVFLAVLEAVVPGFVLLPVGVAAILTAIAAYWIRDWNSILAILAVSEVVTYLGFRRFFGKTRTVPMNAESLIGKECLVIEKVSGHQPGYVKLFGDQWAAQAVDGRVFEVGALVTIVRLDGNKVWVKG